jgi:hypothetical protein
VIRPEQQHRAAQMPAVEQGQDAGDILVKAFIGPRRIGDQDPAGRSGRGASWKSCRPIPCRCGSISVAITCRPVAASMSSARWPKPAAASQTTPAGKLGITQPVNAARRQGGVGQNSLSSGRALGVRSAAGSRCSANRSRRRTFARHRRCISVFVSGTLPSGFPAVKSSRVLPTDPVQDFINQSEANF